MLNECGALPFGRARAEFDIRGKAFRAEAHVHRKREVARRKKTDRENGGADRAAYGSARVVQGTVEQWIKPPLTEP